MNATTAIACHKPQLPQANSTGNAPPMYVPSIGMNCDTTPQNNANGIQYGTCNAIRQIEVKNALSTARMARENRNDEICVWLTVQTNRNLRCAEGAIHWQAARRSFGPAAEM